VAVQVSIDIEAPPEEVYDLVAALDRMGEWSPESTGGVWLDGAAGASVGARFRGRNKRGPLRWSTTCVITAADRGHRLEWENGALGFAVARWTYEFAPIGTGTRVTERFEDRRGRALKVGSPFVMGIADRDKHNRAAMEATLARLKAAIESAKQPA
jgi:uncharacterized protein YndB with AHSA1/START domain